MVILSMQVMDTIETTAQRKARQRRDAADRARAYRQRKRAAGTPLPRDVDAAMTEAIAFWLAREAPRLHTAGIGSDAVTAPLADLLAIARQILVERAGHSHRSTVLALGQRIAARDEHRFVDYVPSLHSRTG